MCFAKFSPVADEEDVRNSVNRCEEELDRYIRDSDDVMLRDAVVDTMNLCWIEKKRIWNYTWCTLWIPFWAVALCCAQISYNKTMTADAIKKLTFLHECTHGHSQEFREYLSIHKPKHI